MARNLSPFLNLPSEIIVSVFEYLSIDALSKLSRTCRTVHHLAMEFGWAAYLRIHCYPSASLACTASVWSAFDRVRYDVKSNEAWCNRAFVARPLTNPWQGKLLPVLAISPSRLVAAAGSSLFVYRFTPPKTACTSPGIYLEASFVLNRMLSVGASDARQDITGIVFLPDGGADCTLCAAFANGAVMRVTLPRRPRCGLEEGLNATPLLEEYYTSDDVIESLSASGNFTLSLSAAGTVCLQDVSSPMSSTAISLNTRSWSTHLSLTSSTPYAAFGTSSRTPLALHAIRNGELARTPYATLGSSKSTEFSRSCAVYGICAAPPSFPSAPEQTLVTGWYDGVVRIYDLRASQRIGAASGIAPVLSLTDPWSYEPVYAVAAGGGNGTHVAAGSARHSVVTFWDVRHLREGWGVHAPGSDSSPVYSVVLESSRLFGATQSRTFVYDFGSGLTESTYPPLDPAPVRGRGNAGLKKLDTGIGYRAVVYRHSSNVIE